MKAGTKEEYVELIESIVKQMAGTLDVKELPPNMVTAYLGTLTAFVASIMVSLEMEANYDLESR
jgi:pyrroline-5-carboxylate reductase